MLGATGSVKGSLDYADTNGQVALHTAILTTISAALKLYYSSTGYYSLTAFIDGMKVGNKVDGKVDIEFNFVVSGAVTVT